MTRLLLCAKSPWEPAIRREHALVRLAAGNGLDVGYLQPPDDVRALRTAPAAWMGALAAPVPLDRERDPARVAVWRRSGLVPAHRGPAAEAADGLLLRRALTRLDAEGAAVVAMLPWQWPAVATAPARRRVFDCADDWTALIPAAAARLRALYRRVGDEADEIVVAAPALAGLFGGRAVTVVPNGTDTGLLTLFPRPRPRRRRMAYVGTLSERFDAELAGAALELLPGWRLALYGPCRYAGLGGRPAPELRRLLERPDVAWAGPVARADLGPVLDAADVLVAPNRAAQSAGQSSMKLYDYAARGRPPVVTSAVPDPDRTPPGLRVADDPVAFAAAVRDADAEGERAAVARVRWARRQTWPFRWPAWSAALLGIAAAEGLREGGPLCASPS